MRILVFGGSVFLSRTAAAEAVRRGHDVVCANRGLSGTLPDGADFVRFDRTDPLPPELNGFDAVIDVGRHPSRVKRAVDGLSDAHWVFVSTISVYADDTTPGQAPGSATVAPEFQDVDLSQVPTAYGPMKVACEQIVRDGAASASIVRPGLIVGPGDPTGRFTYWPDRLARTAEAPTVLAPGRPEDLVQVIDVRDLGAWLVRLAERRLDGTFDATSPTTPLGDWLHQVAAGCGADPEWVWVPQDFLSSQDVAPWSGPHSLPLWVPRPELSGMLGHDPSASLAAGLRVRPLADTARDTLAWLRDNATVPVTGLSLAEEAAVLGAWGAAG